MAKIRKKYSESQLTDSLICSLDIGKSSHSCYIREEGTKVVHYENTLSGAAACWLSLSDYQKMLGKDRIVLGYESTSKYGKGFRRYLSEKGVELVLVNTKHVSRLSEVVDNNPSKNDDKDPITISLAVKVGSGFEPLSLSSNCGRLRVLSHERSSKQSRRTQLLNKLEAHLSDVFPEYSDVMKGLQGKTSLGLLKHYPGLYQLRKADTSSLSNLIRRLSRGRLGKARALSLQAACADSLGTDSCQTDIDRVIVSCIEEIELLDRQIKGLEKRLKEILSEEEESLILQSVKGVGMIGAAVLLGETGGLGQYRNAGQLERLSGLNLYQRSSGNYAGKVKVSKRGRKYLRKILYMLSVGMSKQGGIYRKRYEMYKEKGWDSPKAFVAISRRLLGLLHSLVKRGQLYVASDEYKPKP